MFRVIPSASLSNGVCPTKSGQHLRRTFLILTVLGFILALAANLGSQTIKGTYSFTPDRDVKELLDKLRSQRPEDAIRSLFGESNLYDKELADLLVFIDRVDGTPTRIALLKGGKRKKELWGEKYVYVMVFVAEKEGQEHSASKKVEEEETSQRVTDKSETEKPFKRTYQSTTVVKKRAPLSVHQSSLDYRLSSGEFFLSAMVKLAVAAISKQSWEKSDEAKKGEDIPDKPLKLQKVGKHGDVNLFFDYVKIPIYENTINRITVQEDYGDDSVYRHVATFGNYSASRVTTSVGAVGTIVPATATVPSARPIEPFAFAHVYIKRPSLPVPHYQNQPLREYWDRVSLSLVLGTRLVFDSALFKDIFVGGGIGHFLGPIAFVAGVNFRTPRDAAGNLTEQKRRGHFCAGLTFVF